MPWPMPAPPSDNTSTLMELASDSFAQIAPVNSEGPRQPPQDPSSRNDNSGVSPMLEIPQATSGDCSTSTEIGGSARPTSPNDEQTIVSPAEHTIAPAPALGQRTHPKFTPVAMAEPIPSTLTPRSSGTSTESTACGHPSLGVEEAPASQQARPMPSAAASVMAVDPSFDTLQPSSPKVFSPPSSTPSSSNVQQTVGHISSSPRQAGQVTTPSAPLNPALSNPTPISSTLGVSTPSRLTPLAPGRAPPFPRGAGPNTRPPGTSPPIRAPPKKVDASSFLRKPAASRINKKWGNDSARRANEPPPALIPRNEPVERIEPSARKANAAKNVALEAAAESVLRTAEQRAGIPSHLPRPTPGTPWPEMMPSTGSSAPRAATRPRSDEELQRELLEDMEAEFAKDTHHFLS
ncbi:uncharacterized protein LOC62_07G009577 [Vanrija pseudolonga]|uniref:Uncharacterized protein n=1 Tax=Vanrija pseudolonga TaxID=143232 RepID=A0AAF0YGB8_9TREE|nr:hypothetical protein LOC62_07G009577 [Vanrija pseudolonga]